MKKKPSNRAPAATRGNAKKTKRLALTKDTLADLTAPESQVEGGASNIKSISRVPKPSGASTSFTSGF